jgi:uncharacterized protein YbaA (DUF1428 family)
MSECAIETQSLKKHLGQTRMVDGLDADVPRGAIHSGESRYLKEK